MKKLLLFIPLLLMAGCKTAPLITPAQLQQAVAASTSLGLTVYPSARPDVRIAADIVCSNAGNTNATDPLVLAADIAAAGITNTTSKVIINSALLAYDTVFVLLPTNSAAVAGPYLQALCGGLKQAVPATPVLNKREVPHLR